MKYMGIKIPISNILRVEYKPANGALATGMLQFYIKGQPEKRATILNIANCPNAINFNNQYDAKAAEIKNYLDKRIS